MRRKTPLDDLDPETTKASTIDLNSVEIRGSGKKWHLAVPEAENISSPVKVYDREGKLKDVVFSQVATNKYHDIHTVFESLQEAKDYAEYLKPGCEINIVKSGKPGKKGGKKS